MKFVNTAIQALFFFALLSSFSWAQAPLAEESHSSVEYVALSDVLEAVSENSDKIFLISRHVQPEIVIGQVPIQESDYDSLLQILRNNDLAAVNVDDIVNIIPAGTVREHPLQMMPGDEVSMNEEEWVTGVLHLKNATAASMIPIMRPMMPQEGHLAANPESNTVIIVDRLGNARRIIALIRQLDEGTPTRP